MRDHLDLPQVQALNRYWQYQPPVHMMVAAYLGIKPKPQALSAQSNTGSETNTDIEEQSFIPANKIAATEFSQLLKDKGLTP